MKKLIFLVFIFFISSDAINAQDRTVMIGLTASYEYFKNRTSFTSDKYSKGSIIGLEYSETRGALGFRAGISYSKAKDHIPYFNPDLIWIDIFILPDESPLQVLDFPLSAQIYLGKKRFKGYVNVGFMASISSVKGYKNPFTGLPSNEPMKSLSLRGIYGAGILYQIGNHFNIDLSINQRNKLDTLGNHYLTPRNSFGIQTKFSYVFQYEKN